MVDQECREQQHQVGDREPEDLHRFTREVMAIADETGEGRLVVVMEGGYVPDRLGAGAVSVLRALAGLPDPSED